MKRYIKSATTDNIIYRFKVGQKLEALGLYGGTNYFEVVSRTANTVTVRKSHESEDTGNRVDDGTSTRDIKYLEVYDYNEYVDGDFKFLGLAEAFETWHYLGDTGYCSSEPREDFTVVDLRGI